MKLKIKLKYVRLIARLLAAVVVVFVFLCVSTKQKFYAVIAVLLAVGIGVFETVFYKCPICGKFLGSLKATRCPYCGEVIDENESAQ